jgi:hypothetical protein
MVNDSSIKPFPLKSSDCDASSLNASGASCAHIRLADLVPFRLTLFNVLMWNRL